NDGTPYFLTANHCLGSVNSWSFRFNWRSPNPSCGTTANSTNGTFNQTAAGAILRANNSNSDMALLEITDQAFFNGSPDVVWAGWDRSTTAVPSTVFGVHHPSGDIQKTCREDQSPTRTTNNFNGNPSTQMWRVADWDLGVTEPGSSGSPLFNQAGRIIGKLSGGAAACSGTNDNGGFDIYGRFGVSWDFSPGNSQQLKFWLDPAGTNPITLDRFPPLQVFNNDAQIVIQNVDNELCDETINPTLVLTNRGVQNLTSATITWELNNNGPQTINFTGNLATDQSTSFNIGPLNVNPSPGVQTLAASVTNPNGVPDENANNDSGLTTFELLPDFDTTTVTFNLLTDNFGDETSYELRDSSGSIVASGPPTPFADNTQFNISMPVVFDECYTFTIFDSFGDGICCSWGIGNYSLTTDNSTVIFSSNGSFGSAESTSFRVKQTLSIGDFDVNDFSVYPNPSANIFRVSFPSGIQQLDYTIYDITGRIISSGALNENDTPVDLSTQASGVYFIQFNVEGARISKKLIKL
ncbi:MAG: T9SS type A sorting domain-containing protein, partial [Flavobacteriaceae bacterium]|nr:T9SS type A sorting domain-containing protein [Flavobacteriaceae bacterium]